MIKKTSLFLTALLGLAGQALAADVVVSGRIAASTTWTANNRYQLNGYVFVTNNATLTIEAGTVVQGRVSSGTGAAALVITRGAKINAVGLPEKPIIFTSELDQLNGNLTERDTGLWGGVVLLGRAVINSTPEGTVVPAPIEGQIEGFAVASADVPLITFGGTDDDDSSGVMQYVSIRHGGAVIGTGNEINGLTLGGVGRGTTIDHIEIFANKDDGIECFGGTVNLKYIVSAFGNDDGLDYDTGYRGHVQFYFVIQTDIGTDSGDNGGEWDGATAPEATATPLGGGTVFNATFIGIGSAGRANNGIHIRDNNGAKFYNSILTDYATMLNIDADEQPRLDAGDLDFSNNVFWSHVAANNTTTGVFASGSPLKPASFFTESAKNNVIANPNLRGISRNPDRKLDPRPAAGSPALTGPFKAPTNSFITTVDYKGAFKDTNWAAGWTKLWSDGWFDLASAGASGGDVAVIPNSGNKFINISTLGTTSATGQPLTAGFVIPAGQAQTVLIRGVGPTLTALGVQGALADPVLEVYRSGSAMPFATNDNWSGAQTSQIATKVGAFALGNGSTDAALILNLEPGNYTVQVKGKGTASGTAIVEVYEVD